MHCERWQLFTAYNYQKPPLFNLSGGITHCPLIFEWFQGRKYCILYPYIAITGREYDVSSSRTAARLISVVFLVSLFLNLLGCFALPKGCPILPHIFVIDSLMFEWVSGDTVYCIHWQGIWLSYSRTALRLISGQCRFSRLFSPVRGQHLRLGTTDYGATLMPPSAMGTQKYIFIFFGWGYGWVHLIRMYQVKSDVHVLVVTFD